MASERIPNSLHCSLNYRIRKKQIVPPSTCPECLAFDDEVPIKLYADLRGITAGDISAASLRWRCAECRKKERAAERAEKQILKKTHKPARKSKFNWIDLDKSVDAPISKKKSKSKPDEPKIDDFI